MKWHKMINLYAVRGKAYNAFSLVSHKQVRDLSAARPVPASSLFLSPIHSCSLSNKGRTFGVSLFPVLNPFAYFFFVGAAVVGLLATQGFFISDGIGTLVVSADFISTFISPLLACGLMALGIILSPLRGVRAGCDCAQRIISAVTHFVLAVLIGIVGAKFCYASKSLLAKLQVGSKASRDIRTVSEAGAFDAAARTYVAFGKMPNLAWLIGKEPLQSSISRLFSGYGVHEIQPLNYGVPR